MIIKLGFAGKTEDLSLDPHWNTFIGSVPRGQFCYRLFSIRGDNLDQELLYFGEPCFDPDPLRIPVVLSYEPWGPRLCNLAECENLQEFLKFVKPLCPEITGFYQLVSVFPFEGNEHPVRVATPLELKVMIDEDPGISGITYQTETECLLPQDLSKRLHLVLSLWPYRGTPLTVWLDNFDAYLTAPSTFARALVEAFPKFQFMATVNCSIARSLGNNFTISWRGIVEPISEDSMLAAITQLTKKGSQP